MSYAKKSYVGISRRKVARLGKDCINSKVGLAAFRLSTLPQAAAWELRDVIRSAAANYLVKHPNFNTDDLLIENIIVEAGPTVKRMLPRARGSADRIAKRSCHIKVYLKGWRG